jgi:hypothetical protein
LLLGFVCVVTQGLGFALVRVELLLARRRFDKIRLIIFQLVHVDHGAVVVVVVIVFVRIYQVAIAVVKVVVAAATVCDRFEVKTESG